MADPLSIGASVLAVVSAAIQSARSLYETVNRFKDRNKTLQRLQDELNDLNKILDSLKQVDKVEMSWLALLQEPIDRCSRVCQEFEGSMKKFSQKSTVGFRDWTKMEFMRGDINEFIDTISSYKSTISIGLGIITMQTTKVSYQFLKEYNEMTHDTAYNLELHLQRIDEKIAQSKAENSSITDINIDLKDERAVTEQCLRICEDAKSHLKNLLNQESIILRGESSNIAEDAYQGQFQAQLLTQEALNRNLHSFATISDGLRERLEILVKGERPSNEAERLRLQEDINASKQCLELCKTASEVSRQKVYRVGEVVADGDSDQVVVTTLADLFDIKKALSKGRSAQLVGSMTEESLQALTEKRYASRFGALPVEQVSHQLGSTASPSPPETQRSDYLPAAKHDRRSSQSQIVKPSPNEVRRRLVDEDKQEKGRSSFHG